MNRNDDSFWAWWALTMIIISLQEQGAKPPPSVIISTVWLVVHEFYVNIIPLLRDLRDRSRARKRYRDSQPKSDPVPFWWWRKQNPDPTAEFNHFVRWFHDGAFSLEAYHALYDHFISTGMKDYLHAPEVVCLEWGEYSREQFYLYFICNNAHIAPDDSILSEETPLEKMFQQVFDQVRLRTPLFELKHEADSGEISYTYLMRKR